MRRFLSTTKSLLEGKGGLLDQYNILGAPSPAFKMVKKIGNTDITLSGDLRIPGPVVILNNTAFMWDVPQYGVTARGELDPPQSAFKDASSPFHGWNVELFKLFEIVSDKPDILIIGSGSQIAFFPPEIRTHILSLGIQLEVLKSSDAGSTFNILLQEGRNVAAAILPNVPTSSVTGKQLVDLTTKP